MRDLVVLVGFGLNMFALGTEVFPVVNGVCAVVCLVYLVAALQRRPS